MWTGGDRYQAISVAKEPISRFDPSILTWPSGPRMGGGDIAEVPNGSWTHSAISGVKSLTTPPPPPPPCLLSSPFPDGSDTRGGPSFAIRVAVYSLYFMFSSSVSVCKQTSSLYLAAVLSEGPSSSSSPSSSSAPPD